MTQDEEIEAHHCRQLAEDPVLKKMFNTEIGLCFDELLQTKDATPEGDAKRRELIDRINTIRGVQSRLAMGDALLKQSLRPMRQVA